MKPAKLCWLHAFVGGVGELVTWVKWTARVQKNLSRVNIFFCLRSSVWLGLEWVQILPGLTWVQNLMWVRMFMHEYNQKTFLLLSLIKNM